jgi:hypothetical protein
LEKVGGKVIEGLARFITQQLIIAVSETVMITMPSYSNPAIIP